MLVLLVNLEQNFVGDEALLIYGMFMLYVQGFPAREGGGAKSWALVW